MESRNFESAVAFLASRLRIARPSAKAKLGGPGHASPPNGPVLRGTSSLVGMKQWLQQLGHSSPRLDSLNIIHVAGTKGKGSTCAYIESFLRAQGNGRSFPRKTGLYTSPHLLQMNERIRINFEPLDEARFAQYVFEVRDGLSLYNINHGPRFLQLLAIISIHAFVHEGVDHPVITAITSIGLDHVSDLGPTIEDIAWHKAGILKAGATTFCAPQEPSVSAVLHAWAAAKQVSLKVVGMNTELPGHFASDVQRLNCSLAQAISDEFLRRTVPKGQLPYLSQQAVVDGIQRFHWPGRFEIIRAGQVTWYLDGAHNELSITEAAQWFQIASREYSMPHSILIFAQKSTARDCEAVLKRLAESLHIPIQHAIFTTYYQDKDESSSNDVAMLERYREIWRSTYTSQSQIWIAASVKETLEIARRLQSSRGDTQILVTGSIHLVGTVFRLEHLGRIVQVQGSTDSVSSQASQG